MIAKNRLLKAYGYTSKVASESFFNFRLDDCTGMTADSLYGKGQQLLRRIVAPAKIPPDVEFPLVRGWAYSLLPRRAKLILDSRNINNASEVIEAIQDFLSIDSGKGEGQTAAFKKYSYEHKENRDRRERTTGNCFNCGKIGHKASECWGPKMNNGSRPSAPKSGVAGNGNGSSTGSGNIPKIICFTCGIEGHKSPDCPKKIEKIGKDAKLKSVKRVQHRAEQCDKLDGRVNNYETPILLDSGASVSVVLETMVSRDQMTGESVLVKGFLSTPMKLPMAVVTFEIGDMKWEEEVAVAPITEDGLNEVIYSLKLRSKRGKRLVLLVDESSGSEPEEGAEAEVNMVVTRSVAKQQKQEELEEALDNAQDGPTLVDWNVSRQASEAPVIQEVGVAIPVTQEVGVATPAVQEGGVAVPVGPDVEMDDLGILEEEEEMEALCIELDASDDEKEEEGFVLRQAQEIEPEIEVAVVKNGGSRKELETETRNDPT